jgi:hypothetical protein
VIDLQGNADGKHCATCRRTYGIPVDDPQRCGCCLTGLSLDGIPVFPAQKPDGTWYSPVAGPDGGEAVQLPDGTWTFLIGPFEMFGSREEQIARCAAARAAGDW